MAHIIEVIRNSEAEARSFLDALFYSDSVSAIGFRSDKETIRAVAVNWDEDEISAYCRIFPETVQYSPEWQAD